MHSSGYTGPYDKNRCGLSLSLRGLRGFRADALSAGDGFQKWSNWPAAAAAPRAWMTRSLGRSRV